MIRRLLYILINTILLIVIGIALGYLIFHKNETHTAIIEEEAVYIDSIDHWEVFIEALIWVESCGQINVVGTKNDVGVLQITPIYIAEANQIIGSKGYYTMEDRIDREKSIEIFKVVNAFHNPDMNFERAIKLHNPGAGNEYTYKIMTKYNELCKTYLEK